MGNLQIKNVPPDVHAELRRRARLEGTTIRDYVLELIRRDQARPSRSEWLERLRQLERVEPERPATELIAEERGERERRLESRSVRR